MHKVLIVEDQKEVRDFIKEYFEERKIEIIEATNGVEAIEKIDKTIDLVLLDIMMPYLNGYEVCHTLRENYHIPIIFVSALSEEQNQLKAYEFGADDYVTKPFKLSLLYAKVIALIKRSQPSYQDIIYIGDIELDQSKQQLIINKETLQLTNKEYNLLFYLYQNKNRILTREIILDAIWGYDYFGDGRAVDTYIKRLRKHFKNYSYYIKTIVKSGYMLEVKDNEEN